MFYQCNNTLNQISADSALRLALSYISNKAYKDIHMKGLLKIAILGIVIIFFSLFYSEKFLTENKALNQQNSNSKISMQVFYHAMKIQSITALQEFSRQYPTHPHVDLVESTIERLRYREVVDASTIDAYNSYIANFPNSKFIEEIIYKRAVLINTIEAYELYLVKYPKNRWSKNALYKKARIVDTVDAYNSILVNVYPENDTVVYYRDKAALEEVKKVNTKQAFVDFIEKYPESYFLERAKYERDKSALMSAKEIGTKKAFGEFVETYPNSSWIHQAKYYYTYGYK